MKRVIVILAVVGYLAISHSARGEHSGGTSGGGRQVIQVPAVGSGERLGELINACSVGRPFPGLRTKSIEIDGPPVGEVIPPVQNDQPPTPDGGNTADGSGIFSGRCIKCHEGGVTSLSSLSNLTSKTANGEMPKGGTPLTAAEQAALIAYAKEQGLK